MPILHLQREVGTCRRIAPAMKEFSEIRKEKERWRFEYLSDADPGNELKSAGAIPLDREPGEEELGYGLFHGSATTAANTEAALLAVQSRLRGSGWSWGWNWRDASDAESRIA
jgi:hypothetical protein